MAKLKELLITALWDDESQVWVAESDEVLGLITEAETIELLLEKLQSLVPELLELNKASIPMTLPINFRAERVITYAANG